MSDENLNEEKQPEVSALEMSDEEMMNMPDPGDPELQPVPEEEGTDDAPADDNDDAAAEDDKETEDEDTDTADEEEKEDGEDKEEGDDDTAEDDDADSADEKEEEDAEEEPEGEVDVAKANADFIAKVTAPFRANNKDMKVESAEDVVQLMQMGANYNKKMAAIKPNLKLLKLLENNKLLEEDKLNFLIDVSNGDPKAISKLVKDSKIDPTDINIEEESDYTPSKYKVNDAEVDLDMVLAEIKDSPHYDKTIEVVSEVWDDKSKQKVAESPQLLTIINDHLASGVYELISQKVEKERMFGRLTGISDIDAYQKIGDAIQAEGGFDHLFKENTDTKTPDKPVKRIPTDKSKDDKGRKDKKRAAAPPKGGVTAKKTNEDFNPLALSDEEFDKQTNSLLF